MSTALPYPLQAFANKHLNTSLVSAYYALQPIAAVILSLLATAAGLADLRKPTPTDLLGIATILGLGIVVAEELRTPQTAANGGGRGRSSPTPSVTADDVEVVVDDVSLVPRARIRSDAYHDEPGDEMRQTQSQTEMRDP